MFRFGENWRRLSISKVIGENTKRSNGSTTRRERVAIPQRHLLESPVSKLCDEIGLKPTSYTTGKGLNSGEPTIRSERSQLHPRDGRYWLT